MDFIENIHDIHIGEIIRAKLREKSMTVTEFARRINTERSNAHHILRRKSLDTEFLITISKALDYDFIRNVYYKKQTPPAIFDSIKTEEELFEKLDLLEEFIRFVKSKG